MRLRYLPQIIVMVFAYTADVRFKVRASDSVDHSIKNSHTTQADGHSDVTKGANEERSAGAHIKEGHQQKRESFSALARVYREPRGCTPGEERCYQLVHNGPYQLAQSGAVWVFGNESVFRWSKGETRLMKGWLTVSSESVEYIELGSATVSFSGGRILIHRTDLKVEIINISSNIVVTPRGKSVGFDLPKGFSVAINPVGLGGFAQAEIIQAVEIKQLISDWSQLAVDEASFRGEVLSFKQSWQDAVILASQWHEASVVRKIAAVDRARKNKRLRRAKIEKEDSELRKLYRKKMEQ